MLLSLLKAIWIYAKNHQYYTKLTKHEIIFLLFAYKIYPFINDKKEFIKNIEIIIQKSEYKNKFLKLHKYFQKISDESKINKLSRIYR